MNLAPAMHGHQTLCLRLILGRANSLIILANVTKIGVQAVDNNPKNNHYYALSNKMPTDLSNSHQMCPRLFHLE